MSEEIIANFDNLLFLSAVKHAEEGDVIPEKFGNLIVVKVFADEETYEERLQPTVMFRRKFAHGILLRKDGSNTFIFVPDEELAKAE